MIDAESTGDVRLLPATDKRRSLHCRNLVDGYSGGQRVVHSVTSPADLCEEDRELIDDGGDDAVLRRVLSDVRRAYCRQPSTGTSVIDSNVTDSQRLPTEFIKQLSDYSDADRTAISSSSVSSSTSASPELCRPHISRSTSMVTERSVSSTRQSTTTTGWRPASVNKGTVGGGSGVRFGDDRGTRENRVSLRPRRALSLDRPVSLPPFLRPIEEEDSTSTGPGRTPMETMFGGQMTSPPSSPASSSSTTDDDDDMPTNTGSENQRIHRRRHHDHVDAKLYGQDRWMNLCSSTVSQFGTVTTEKLSRPSTICWGPDYGANCFDSDEECPCTSAVRSASAAAGRRPRFERRVAPSVQLSRDSCQLSIPCQSSQSGDVLSTCAPALTTLTESGDVIVHRTAASSPDGITVTSVSGAEIATSSIDVTVFHDAGGQQSANASDVTTSQSEVSSHVMLSSSSLPSSKIHFYVLMTSVAVFGACLTSASPICLAALVALTSLATYPIAKF